MCAYTDVLWVDGADVTTCVPTFIATLVHGSVRDGCFLECGGTPPFLPRPLDIVGTARAVIFGTFFFFFTAAKNCANFPLLSATATEWEHKPIDFQFGQLVSHVKPPPFTGVTICGVLLL